MHKKREINHLCAGVDKIHDRWIQEESIKNELFTVADTFPYSTCELIEKVAKDNAETCVQFCVPKIILNATFKAIGKPDLSSKLPCDLQIDNRKAVRLAENSVRPESSIRTD